MRLATILTALIILTTTSTQNIQTPAKPPTLKQYAKAKSLSIWHKREWRCLKELWHRESRWNAKANNPKSTAYGIPQILGLDPKLTPYQQIDKGIEYIQHRYDEPCLALKHHYRYGWY